MVVAARAAKRARSGGWGGGVWVGPAHSKKRTALIRPILPPPTALWELDGRCNDYYSSKVNRFQSAKALDQTQRPSIKPLTCKTIEYG